MKKSVFRVLTILFLCAVPVWMLICRDRSFSEKENRNLKQYPKFSWKMVTDGSFMEDMESYFLDQFPLRDQCMEVRTTFLEIMGQRKINDVYVGKNGYLIAAESTPDSNQVKDITDAINDFKERHSDVPMNFMLVPNSSYVNENRLPYGIKSNQKQYMDEIYSVISKDIGIIDIRETLLNKNEEYLYYKTDHHWTTLGAYEAFKTFAKADGIDTDGVKYDFYTVSGEFKGTQASNSGIFTSADTIRICVPENSEGTYVVDIPEQKKKSTSLFDVEMAGEKDAYLVFLGGNYAEIDVETSNRNNKNLLVIKDSYANCFIPLLTPYYENIIVVDPRYFYDNIDELMEINDITEVLFLYNVNSFLEDKSLKDVLNEGK